MSGRLPHVQSCTFALAYIINMFTYVGSMSKDYISPFATVFTAQWEIIVVENIKSVPATSVLSVFVAKAS